MKSKNTLKKLVPYLFIVPQLIFFTVFLIIPTIIGAWASLNKWDYISKPKFVGLKNYIDLFTSGTIDNQEYWRAFGNTFKFVLFAVPPLVVIGLLLAIMLNTKIPGKNIIRGIIYAPNVLSVASASLLFVWMMDTNAGLINYYIVKFGGKAIPWLTTLPWAWIALVLLTVWWTVGGNMLLFLAGLQDIPASLYEAGDIDGANGWQKFTNITLPSLRRTLLFVIVMTSLNQFNVFGQPLMTTGGGPGGETKVLIMYIREVAFSQYRMGSASAMAIVMGLAMLLFSIIQFKVLQPKKGE